MNDPQFWQSVLGELRLQMSAATFETWLARSRGDLAGDTLTVVVASEYARDWLSSRLTDVISRTVARLAGEDIQLVIEVGEVGQASHSDSSYMVENSEALPAQPHLRLLSADQILSTDWPEPVWAIPDLLPTGLAILAGKPKLGKSWLALQIAQAVASGGMALDRPIDQGPILYLALEDPPRRLQDRMNRQHWQVGTQADFMPLGEFHWQIGDLCNGGGDRLAAQIEKQGYKLVVIDTLSRAIIGDQNDVERMTQALAPLQEIAHDLNCVVLLVDHHRKGGSADAIGDIMGSTAKGAMADCIWGLYREHGQVSAKLAINGRDVAETTLDILMDWETGCWQMERLTDRQQEILDALSKLGPSPLMAIVEIIGQDRSNTHRRLQQMVVDRKIRRYTADDGGVIYECVL